MQKPSPQIQITSTSKEENQVLKTKQLPPQKEKTKSSKTRLPIPQKGGNFLRKIILYMTNIRRQNKASVPPLYPHNFISGDNSPAKSYKNCFFCKRLHSSQLEGYFLLNSQVTKSSNIKI